MTEIIVVLLTLITDTQIVMICYWIKCVISKRYYTRSLHVEKCTAYSNFLEYSLSSYQVRILNNNSVNNNRYQ